MTSLGIDTMLPPVSITDPDYAKKVAVLSTRARASEMEHAIRHHISVHVDEDPTRYRRLSERLEQILADHAGNWEQQVLALTSLLEDLKDDDTERTVAGAVTLGPVESALYGLLAEETSSDGVIDSHRGQQLVGFCRALHEMAMRQTTRTDFWRHPVDQDNFTKEIVVALVTGDVWHADRSPEEAQALADKLFAVIKAQRHRITTPS
jgi:type I restriction enzyme R subunit